MTSGAGPYALGETITYSLVVTNTGNVTLTNVTVSDPKLGLNRNIGTLTVGEVVTLTDSYGPVSEADLPGPIFNAAGVTGTPPVGPPTDPVTDTHTVPVVVGSLAVTKVVVPNETVIPPDQSFTICIKGPSYPNGTEAGAC